MKIWLFRENSYKKALLRLIEESDSSRGMVSRLAAAIGCQRSYLSQVLHGKAQLTKDQAWNVGAFFSLSLQEARYFECLVDFERASSAAYRKHLQGQMDAIRVEAGKLEKQFPEGEAFREADALEYFANWLTCAVHVLSSIPEFQDPPAIAERLGVRVAKVRKTLSYLQSKGLVEQKKGRWIFAKGPRYSTRESGYVAFHHQNWRQAAVDDSRRPEGDGLHFTMVQSMSRKDIELIKGMVLEFVAKTKKIAEPSAPEELTAFTLDFFQPG